MPPFGLFADVLPRQFLASLLCWAVANYFLISPQMAARVARADFIPICEANFKDAVMQAQEDRTRALTLPSTDPAQEYALSQARRMLNSPMMDYLRGASRGMGDMFGIDVDGAAEFAMSQAQAAKRAARDAYEHSKAAIERQTTISLASAGSVCGCVADKAIEETRTDWAIYTGTLTVIEPAPIAAFDQTMAQVFRTGSCGNLTGGSQ